jgi:hypothetical protein
MSGTSKPHCPINITSRPSLEGPRESHRSIFNSDPNIIHSRKRHSPVCVFFCATRQNNLDEPPTVYRSLVIGGTILILPLVHAWSPTVWVVTRDVPSMLIRLLGNWTKNHAAFLKADVPTLSGAISTTGLVRASELWRRSRRATGCRFLRRNSATGFLCSLSHRLRSTR